jgi:hypothetical protein
MKTSVIACHPLQDGDLLKLRMSRVRNVQKVDYLKLRTIVNYKETEYVCLPKKHLNSVQADSRNPLVYVWQHYTTLHSP